MDEDFKAKMQELIDKRAEILYQLCHDEKLFHPEVLIGMIQEVRGITKVLIILGLDK